MCFILLKLLKRKWKSILHHVANVHRWEEDGVQYECDHEPMTDTQREKKKWLHPHSPAYKALTAIVNDKRLAQDLNQLNHFKHTGMPPLLYSFLSKAL